MDAARWQAWHETIAWALIAVNGVAGVWALFAQRVPAFRGRPLWATILIGQLTTFAMALTGVVMVNRYGRRLDDFHALYGFSTIITVGILASYRRSNFVRGNEYLLYGFGCLFLMGLGIRNLTL